MYEPPTRTHNTHNHGQHSWGPAVICIGLGAAAITSTIPSLLGLGAIALILSIICIQYLHAFSFHDGYTACCIAATCQFLTALMGNPDEILPYTGAFYYAGFAFVKTLEALSLWVSNVETKSLIIKITEPLAFGVAGYLAVSLVPNTSAYWLPPLICIPISSLVDSTLKTSQNKRNWEHHWSAQTTVRALVIASLTITCVHVLVPQEHETNTVLSALEKAQLEQAAHQATDSQSIDSMLEVARLSFQFNQIPSARHWFEKVLEKEPGQPIAKGYRAVIDGMRARNKKLGPTTRLNIVSASSKELDAVIQKNPTLDELRFARASYYFALPSFFKKREVAISDLQLLLVNKDTPSHFFCRAADKLTDVEPDLLASLDPSQTSKVNHCP